MIILLFGNFILMAYDARASDQQRVLRVWAQTAANFVQSPVTYATSAVTGFFNTLAGLRLAQDENTRLKQRVQELEVQDRGREELSDEVKRLKELLDLKDESKYDVLFAQIIGRDTAVWFDSAIINLGTLDGVRLNMPVVVNGGLVGRITAVSPLTAQVNLITSDKSGIGSIVGELGSSNALGVVRGTGSREVVEMKYVPGYVKVAEGEVIYTTGQGGVYPPGLRIGRVIKVTSGSATIPHTILIRPTAKLSSMQEVAVLLYTAPTRPAFREAIPNAVSNADENAK